MTEDKLEVTFKCSKCGPTTLELPDNYTDDSIAKCKSCGTELGRFGDIKANALDAARDYASATIRDTLKGIKGLTIK